MSFFRSYRIYTLTAGLIFFHKSGHTQIIPDSLSNKLAHAANDSVKTRTLLDIGEAIEAESPEKSRDYYLQALENSKKINNKRLMVSSMVDVGISYIESNDLDKA